jgi:hypothetical protein
MAKAKKQPSFKPVCGMDEDGTDAFLDDAEQQDVGTSRFPWDKSLKADIKAAISGMQHMPHVKEKVNELVVAKAGPGLFGRGPFKLPGMIQ